jgi:predicted ATPase
MELGNSAVAESLRTLQDRELVFPQPHSRFAGTVEQNFRHALLRDVAYETVLKRLRREYHSLAADWLIENSGDRLGESAGLIADHLAQSGREEEALHYLVQAARLAITSSADQEAIDYLLNALRLLENQPETAELTWQKLDLLTQLGRHYYVVKGWGSREALQTFEKAQTLIQKGGTPHQRFAVLQGLSGSAIGRGEWRKALAYAEQLLQMAEVSNHITLRLWAHYSLGMVNYHGGNIIAAKEHLNTLLDLYEPERHGKQFRRIIGDPRLKALTYLSWIYWELGYPEKSTTYSETALIEAGNLDHPFTMIETLLALTIMHLFFRNPAEKVLEFTTRTMSLADKENVPDYWAWAAIAHGWALIKLGQPTGAIELMNRGFGSLLDRESKLSITYSLKLLSEAYQMMGELEKALEMAGYALVQVEETGQRFLESELNRLKGDLQRQNNADPLEVEALYRKALEIAQGQQAKSFELRVAISLARLWKGQGKTNEAYALLSEIYSWFTEGFDTADLQEARGLLDELA